MAVEPPLTSEQCAGDRRQWSRSRLADTRPPGHRLRPGLGRARRAREAGQSTRAPTFPQRLWRATWPKLDRLRPHPAGLADRGLGPLEALHPAVAGHGRPTAVGPARAPAPSGRRAGPPPSRRSSGTPWSSSSAASSAPPWPACACCGPASASLITGMQTMPSVLWYPLGFMVFGVNWKAIILMMVLGRRPGGGQRLHQRHRPGAPGPAPGGSHPRRPRAGPRAPRGAARRLPERARRAQAGVGLRLARPDGRRVPHPGHPAEPRRPHGERRPRATTAWWWP